MTTFQGDPHQYKLRKVNPRDIKFPFMNETTADDVFDELAFLTGRLNLSLNSACSNEMCAFIRKCILYGIELSKKKNPESELNSNFSKVNRENLRKRLITIANKEHRKKMEKYCSLAIDEGTTMRTQYLDFVLHNSSAKLGEYPAAIQKMDGQNSECYTISILNGLYKILKYNLVPSTIVIDGGTPQKKALSLN